MHGPLRQQTQKHQIRRRQLQFSLRVSNFLQSLRAPLFLCVTFSLFPSLVFFISLRPYFVASSCCSTTTTGTSPPPAADSSPAPPPRKKYRAGTDPAAAPSLAPSFHTSAVDSASPVAPRCESRAIQNPAPWPDQWISNLRAAVSGAVRLSFVFPFRHSLKISLTSFLVFSILN